MDNYDAEDIDDENDFDSLDMRTRKLVEAKLARRDRQEAKKEGKFASAYMEDGMQSE